MESESQTRSEERVSSAEEEEDGGILWDSVKIVLVQILSDV